MKFYLLVIASIAFVALSVFTQAVTAAPLALNRRQQGTPTTAGEVIATPAATAASTATAPPAATATDAGNDSGDENDGNDSGDEDDGNESGNDSDDENGGAATATATATVTPSGTPAATPAPQGEAPAPTGGVEVVTARAPAPTIIAA
ncbi:hypothetical protein BC832DRAFT_593634 [Gaertneriomyces semiglobifer]|nr:hypothetical protein BC832DRAFT_593634 [Gaertneriomyces semiglobifer]